MRDLSVTYSKSIGILLMVLGHACYSTMLETWVNMFHVPIFFFMSGYCFKEEYFSNFKTFSYKRFKGIYWPFIKWTFLFIALHNVLYSLGIYNAEYGFNGKVSVEYSFVDYLQKFKNVCLYMNETERLLGGYWFLTSLFLGSFIFYLISYKTIGYKPLGGG